MSYSPFKREFWWSLWRSPLFRAALIILGAVISYLPATHCGFIWDDDVYVTENPLLSAPDGLRRIWFSLDSPSQYFPLVYTTFRMEHAVWGLNPTGYHWINILLHIGNALLLWRLLSSLKLPGAWLAAAIFAVHPVNVESVAWITERKNVLMLFFFLLSLISWVAFLNVNTKHKWTFYSLTLSCYAFALFSKTTACTLPAALLLILWLKHNPVTRQRLLQVIPFVGLGAGMGLLTVWWERYHQGTHGKLFAIGIPERLLIVSHATWFYLGKLFWPANLTFSYPLWALHPSNPLSYGWIIAGFAFCWLVYCAREDIGRGAEVAGLFYVATLSPVLGLIMLYTFRYSFVADHYQYAASIGPIALISGGIATVAESRNWRGTMVRVCAAFVIIALGILTWNQCHIYRDDESVWRDTIAKNPSSLMAHFNLANQLMRQGRFAESLAHYTIAVGLDPTFSEARCNRADNYVVLGKLREAAADYSVAVKLDPENGIIEYGFGNVLKKMGQLNDAIPHFREAVRIQPNYALWQKTLGDALASQSHYSEALLHYKRVASLVPNAAQPHLILGSTFFTLAQTTKTVLEYREALRIDPSSPEALTRLAWVLATCGNPNERDGAEAVLLAEKACRLTDRQNAVALATLAAAYASSSRYVDAVTTDLDALIISRSIGQKDLAATLLQRLRIYQTAHSPDNKH